MNASEPDNPRRASLSTSRSLLDRARAKESDAWERLADLYAPLVFHWCRRARVPEADLPDIFQEVFAAVARNLAGFRKRAASDTFRGWLRTITRNKIHDHYRRRQQTPRATGGSTARMRFAEIPMPIELEDGDPSDASVEADLLRRALAAVRPHFHERTWQAFWRCVVDGADTSTVSEELELSPGAIRVARSRVLHRLRAELGELRDPEP